MKTDAKAKAEEANPGGKPLRIRLPGFIKDDEIGLGDAITRVTHSFGLRPCGGCTRRSATLNRWLVMRR